MTSNQSESSQAQFNTFSTTECENVMKYLTVIYYGNAFRWLFLQIKTVQILLQFVLSLIFPIYANFTNYSANLNLYPRPPKPN